jgi:hypothetical protein
MVVVVEDVEEGSPEGMRFVTRSSENTLNGINRHTTSKKQILRIFTPSRKSV